MPAAILTVRQQAPGKFALIGRVVGELGPRGAG